LGRLSRSHSRNEDKLANFDQGNLDPLGLRTRRKVLGNSHVDRAIEATNEFDAAFQQLITEAAWGQVWSRQNLTLRDRSLITIALLAALGHDEEVEMHLRATSRTGARKEEVVETLLHVAIYAGVPAANRAFRIAKKVFSELQTQAPEMMNDSENG